MFALPVKIFSKLHFISCDGLGVSSMGANEVKSGSFSLIHQIACWVSFENINLLQGTS